MIYVIFLNISVANSLREYTNFVLFILTQKANSKLYAMKKNNFRQGALVFNDRNPTMWWKFEIGANWQHPYGPNSAILGKDNHPVVQVSWYDAKAYAHWSGKSLPTEAEWEYAAKGGTEDLKYFWGNEFSNAVQKANFFQGNFPIDNSNEDGYGKSAEVKSFATNGYGLYDMAGNVWEWCLDTYYPNTYTLMNKREDGYFKKYFNKNQEKVMRGGSFLCAD